MHLSDNEGGIVGGVVYTVQGWSSHQPADGMGRDRETGQALLVNRQMLLYKVRRKLSDDISST